MDHRQDNTTGLLLSLAVHAVFFVCLALAMLSCDRYNAVIERLQLPQFLGVQCMKPVSVEGPIIEATLVKFTAPPLPRTAPRPVRPVRQPPPKPQERVETPELPPAPPVADDRINQDRVDRDGQLPPDAEQREQEEKRRREQQLLEEQERLTRVEQDRQQQLEDIKKQREEAERVRKIEEQRLAQLEDKQREDQAEQQRDVENKHLQDLLEQANLEQQAGNEGTDNDLTSRYILALQNKVTDNWLRPDSAQPGLLCQVRIVQIPGGEVLSATVMSPCNGDESTRESLEQAVMRAQPLPYEGYESVFQRTITFNFSFKG